MTTASNSRDLRISAAAKTFDQFFKSVIGQPPREFQRSLAIDPWPETLIIPTGFGKTDAVIGAWLWHSFTEPTETPRRLIYCLPMRCLVEQTARRAEAWRIAATEYLHVPFMLDQRVGGELGPQIPAWILRPEHRAIIIGTQDILVSAGLMRGYGVSRYRWPADFALLHNDCLWAFDEVQLAGATLGTSAQLEAFRRQFGSASPCRSLWMSATLDPTWLNTVNFTTNSPTRHHDLPDEDLKRAPHLWFAKKHLERFGALPATASDWKLLATAVCASARPNSNTFCFLNTVARARLAYAAIKTLRYTGEAVLLHSRFRSTDRATQLQQALTSPPQAGRIIVATQALEAGVDISSSVMFTELAPWGAMVQRFGRCNRHGECGVTGSNVFWIDVPDETSAPYRPEELAKSREILARLPSCGPYEIANLPTPAPSAGPILRRKDLLDLFDTESDLNGFDLDVSSYIRDATDTDVHFFWRQVVAGVAPSPDAKRPSRAELCAVSIGEARRFLAQKQVRAWTWNPLAHRWQAVIQKNIVPGSLLLIACDSGGYSPALGFDPKASRPVSELPPSAIQQDIFDMDEESQADGRVTLPVHTSAVVKEITDLASQLSVPPRETAALVEAALWHDLGKNHPVFRYRCGLSSGQPPLAKSPDYNWRRPGETNRPFFRHELASALAYLDARGWETSADLPAYLIAAHHGKVRMRIRALPKERRPPAPEMPFARGVWSGDHLPSTDLGTTTTADTVLDLEIMRLGMGARGASWQERTQKLLRHYGPFRLARLEALLRIADWRTSAGMEMEIAHE